MSFQISKLKVRSKLRGIEPGAIKRRRKFTSRRKAAIGQLSDDRSEYEGMGVMMKEKKVRGLAEIALRVTDLERMQEFYENVVGLELMRRFPQAAFFKIADGHKGHTQIMALFDRKSQAGYQGLSADLTTVDHIAFSIELSDYRTEKERLEALGLDVRTAEHGWVQWRSLYFFDPEGNEVEFVCYDESQEG